MATFAHSFLDSKASQDSQQRNAAMVSKLGLTDLALFTEARYLRHLSQADLNTAFQDHPMSLDHFPGGSLISAPTHWGKE